MDAVNQTLHRCFLFNHGSAGRLPFSFDGGTQTAFLESYCSRINAPIVVGGRIAENQRCWWRIHSRAVQTDVALMQICAASMFHIDAIMAHGEMFEADRAANANFHGRQS